MKHGDTFDSTCLSFWEWDDQTLLLSLWFRDDRGPYDFQPFTREEVDEMLSYKSPGTWWNYKMRGMWTRKVERKPDNGQSTERP